MLKRRAMKPSTPSDTPAATNSMKARPHRSCPIMTTISGTEMRRAMVMRLGIVIRLGWRGPVLWCGFAGRRLPRLALREADPYCPKPIEERLMAGELRKGLTYAEAGVDIDAGNAMVEAI